MPSNKTPAKKSKKAPAKRALSAAKAFQKCSTIVFIEDIVEATEDKERHYINAEEYTDTGVTKATMDRAVKAGTALVNQHDKTGRYVSRYVRGGRPRSK